MRTSIEWPRRRGREGLWTQLLHGKRSRCIGPAHGVRRCALALGDVADATETLEPFAVEEDDSSTGGRMMRLDGNRDGLIRTQWCHGAPGIVATLALFLDEERRRGRRADVACGAAAEGRGPATGPRATATRFLALLERTGDERWLARARAFAMPRRPRSSTPGRSSAARYTLWTGDLGTALYLADCVEGGGRLPPAGASLGSGL